MLNNEELSKLDIHHTVSPSKHNVTIDEGELGSILMNLIQNSIYWLGPFLLLGRLRLML